MLYIECVDCGDELLGKRLEAVDAWQSYCKRQGLKPGPSRCLVCQELAEEQGRASQAKPALAVLSEGDDATRVVEEGWPQDGLLSFRQYAVPKEDDAA